MPDSYRAVLAIAAAGDREPDWPAVLTSVRASLAAVDVDWSDVHVQRTSSGRVLLLPPSALDRLAGDFFLTRLAAAVAADQPPLRLGLAAGMGHHDGRGWFGEAVAAARSMADAGRSSGSGPLSIVLTDAVHGQLPPRTAPRLFRMLLGGGRLRDIGPAARPPGPAQPAPAPAIPPDRPQPDRPQPDRPEPSRPEPDRPEPDRAVESRLGPAAEVIEEMVRSAAAAVDALPARLAPASAPPEVLAWLYQAFGVEAADRLTERQGRRLLPHLLDCYRRRGTAAGLRALLSLRYGVPAEIVDSGTTTWSAEPTRAGPPAPAHIVVRLAGDRPLPGLDEVIRSALPVGVGYRVERH